MRKGAARVHSELFDITTSSRLATDITGLVESFCHGRGDDLCQVFVPHATAGVALFEPSVTIPVLDGRPMLGTWQSVVLVDPNGDNPHRQVRLSFLAG